MEWTMSETHNLSKEVQRSIFLTREWGRIWVGCSHGKPKSGVNPTRICLDCFKYALNLPKTAGKRLGEGEYSS
jgi:hypothetical protein